ncbi:hypothetical protein KCV07_g9909, partial [Aureobasidium melanogenum]
MTEATDAENTAATAASASWSRFRNVEPRLLEVLEDRLPAPYTREAFIAYLTANLSVENLNFIYAASAYASQYCRVSQSTAAVKWLLPSSQFPPQCPFQDIPLLYRINTLDASWEGLMEIYVKVNSIFFLAACGAFMAIGVIEQNEGLAPIVKLAELSILGIAMYLLNQCFFKLSMAFFFLQISNRRAHRWIIVMSVTLSISSNLALLAISIGQCGNIVHTNLTHLQCLSWTILGPLNYFCATLNAIVDWIFAVLAIYIIKGLTLDSRSRVSLCVVVLLASAGSIVSIVRIPYISGLRVDKSYYSQENDIIAYTSLIESAVGIVVASMSVMQPLINKVRRGVSAARNPCPRDDLPQDEALQARPSQKIIFLPDGIRLELFQAIPSPTPSIGMETRDVEMNCSHSG